MPYISHYTQATQALGPGKRFAVWFQGCEKKCPHCINPAGQNKEEGVFFTVDELMQKIKTQDCINGVTISGGEPFLQFDELQLLVSRIKKETKLDVMLYSGYTFEYLTAKYDIKFFNQLDIFIDGEYVYELDNNSLYRGSDNQRIFFMTSKYKKYEQEILNSKSRKIEFEFDENNELFLVGVPPKDFYKKLKQVLSCRS